MRYHILCLTAALLGIGLLGTGVAAEKRTADQDRSRWALLIGVDDYVHVEKLRFAGADQRALREQLIAAGFPKKQVFLLDDKSEENKYRPFKANIERELHQVLGLVEPEDLVVVSLSGHGVHLDGKSYFCPTEARLEDPHSLVSLEEVYDRLQKCPAALKLLLVDACRNDPRREGQRSLTLNAGTKQFAESLERPPEGLLLLSSCAPGQISLEDKKFGHGVFMHFVLEGLQGQADADRDGRVSLMELYRFANKQTKLYVHDQFSEYQTPALRGQINDDFDIALVRPEPRLSGGVTGMSGTATGLSATSAPSRPAATTPSTSSPSADPRLTPVALESMLAVGESRWRTGSLSEALLLFDWAVRLAPGSAAAQAHRAAACFAANRQSEADSARQLAGDHPLPFFVRKDATLEEGGQSATVNKDWTVYVDRIEGTRFHVKSTREMAALSGWIGKEALVESNSSPSREAGGGLVSSLWDVSDSDGERYLIMFGQGALYMLSKHGFRAGGNWQAGAYGGPLRISIDGVSLEGTVSGQTMRGAGSSGERNWTWEARRL